MVEQERVAWYHEHFAGKWCLVHTRTGLGIEGRILSITDLGVTIDEMLNVYNEIQPIMPREAVLEPCIGVIALADVDWIRTGDRTRAERLCRALNTTHLVSPRRPNG
jgi:hypothetical protein